MRELTPEFVFEQACSWLHRWRDACTVPLETVQASAAFIPSLNRNF
jgi:hypothetical protein